MHFLIEFPNAKLIPMKRKWIIRISILLILVTVSYTYFYFEFPKINPALDDPYTNQAGGYSIRFPKGWNLNPKGDGSNGTEGNPSLTPDSSPWAQPPEDIAKTDPALQVSNTISAQLNHDRPQDNVCHSLDACANHIVDNSSGRIKNSSITKTNVGGYDARLIEFDEGGTITTHWLVLMIYKGTQEYTVDAIFDSHELWEKHQGVIRASLSSFTFI